MQAFSILSVDAEGSQPANDTLVMRALPPEPVATPVAQADAKAKVDDVVDWSDAGETQVLERPAVIAKVPEKPPEAIPPRSSAGTGRVLAGVGFFVFASLAVAGLGQKYVRSEGGPAPAAVPAPPRGHRIVVAAAEMLPPGRPLSLVGEVRPARQITLYAKVSGYLKEVRVDKGDTVKAGQILGVLESPDTDQRILSAQAEYGVRSRQAKRSHALVESGATPSADSERTDADLTIAASELSRAIALKSYATIRAPFAGVITARYADPGALLQAATSSAQASLPLAELSDMRSVRITVYVGQNDAPFVKEGTGVTVFTDAEPTRRIEATVTRTTRTLDVRTRTLQCEIELPNAEDRFTPGSTVHVNLTAASPSALAVPVEGVFVHRGRAAVMLVRDGKVAVTAVETGDHDGKLVRILSGLAEGDLVALNASHELTNGAPIEPVRKAPDPPARR